MLLNNHHCCASIYGPIIKVRQAQEEGKWFIRSSTSGPKKSFLSFFFRYCNLNHFNAQNISGSNLEETLPLHEKSLKFYGSIQEFSSSIDLWETALWNSVWLNLSYEQSIHCFLWLDTMRFRFRANMCEGGLMNIICVLYKDYYDSSSHNYDYYAFALTCYAFELMK